MFNKLKQFKDLRSQAKQMQNALAQESIIHENKGVKITINGNMEIIELKPKRMEEDIMILHDGRQSHRLAPNRPYMSHPKRADFALTLSPPPPLRFVVPQLTRFRPTVKPLTPLQFCRI